MVTNWEALHSSDRIAFCTSFVYKTITYDLIVLNYWCSHGDLWLWSLWPEFFVHTNFKIIQFYASDETNLKDNIASRN